MADTFPEITIALADYQPHKRNYNRHPASQIERLRASLRKFGQPRNIVVWRKYFVAGHGVAQAAMAEGWATLRANEIPADWPETRVMAFLAADNELSRLSDPDQAALAALIDEARQFDGELLAAIGYDDKEFAELLKEVGKATATTPSDASPQVDRADELRKLWQVKTGDIWRMGDHFLACGDCREPDTWRRLLSAAGIDKVNGVFTSPPYAMRRKDQYGGVETDQYVEWWDAVQANVKANLAEDGSFFVNIKAHCEDGQRVLYCMDLVCAMVRRWGWRFVDEMYWKTAGIPGLYKGRFRNVIESVYHFSYSQEWKWNPRPSGEVKGERTAHGYSVTGSGIQSNFEYSGDALPTNCIETASAGHETKDAFNAHSAMFPVALPDFFIRAYSDPGDVWLDPFCGSGTTIVAAENNKRRGLGSERLPKYCAVILERMQTAFPGIEIERLNG